ncbi:MAG TPA: sigma-70 family RNA polymerase sigma factor [Bryobacteraceae bacterium]|nr:sigma-70 family RNA polymerase sigma factor [Bryobacteraceae bacterium]
MHQRTILAVEPALGEVCPAAETPPNSHDVVEMIRSGKPGGLERLYFMARNFTFFIMRQLGNEDVQDKVHDVFVAAAQAIHSGKLRDSSRLTPFLTTVTRFYTYGQIERRMVRRKYHAPLESTNIPDSCVDLEQGVYLSQKTRIVREILQSMAARDRDVLYRFYVAEQSKEQICKEMKLTPTQFRLLKSKAKSLFAKLGRRRLKTRVAA